MSQSQSYDSSQRSYKRRKVSTYYPRRSRSRGDNRTYNRRTAFFRAIGLPPTIVMKHRYSETFQLDNTGSATIPAYHQFRLNSVYDPNYTGTGHQPYYYDQMAALYNYYCVYGCVVEIEAGTETTTSTCLLAFSPTLDGGTPMDADILKERPQSRWATLDAGGEAKTLSKYYRIASLFGRTKRQLLSDDTFASPKGGNPGKTVYLNINGIATDKTAVAKINCAITMTFYVQWYGRADNAGS